MKRKIIYLIISLIAIVLICYKVVLVFNTDTVEDYNFGNIPNTNSCVALDYHRVRNRTIWNSLVEKVIRPDELVHYSVYTDEFESQIDKLIDDGAYFATYNELEEFRKNGNFPDKCVWICFDDADKTLYTNAYPILKKKNIPFTVFVIAGQVGNEDFSNLELCTWSDLKEMRDSGLASFGSHTYDMHYFEDNGAKFLEKDIYNDFYEDIKKSKEVLEKELEVQINSIAYPFGESSDALADLSEKAGFKSGFILAPYAITLDNDDYYLNRYMIDRNNFRYINESWNNN